ncbi:SDR family NAD(P)-dependent oxidoreductase [Herpetosiphon gulosus]|uniref:Short-chain dehydrogenase n=1 Tax=Herpetosiphon gulosus TaxID=1973496 RepID=A0ABP9WYP1_9CHLR
MQKIALITGASGGIGQAITQGLAEHGWQTVLIAREPTKLNQTVQVLQNQGHRSIGFSADVRDSEAVQRVLTTVMDEVGTPSAVINLAGVLGPFGQFHDLDLAQLRAMCDTIWWGTLNLCHAVIPAMIERGGGSIINIAGYGAVEASPRLAAYGAIKAAIVRLSETLAMELKRQKIRVNCIGPGLVATKLSTELESTPEAQRFADGMVKMAQTKGVSGQEAAKLVRWLLAEDNPLTGRLITVHDDYEQLSSQLVEINHSSRYTLRRIND